MQSEKNHPQSGGLLAGVQGMFQQQTKTTPDRAKETAEALAEDLSSTEAFSGAPSERTVEEKLADIPDYIGPEGNSDSEAGGGETRGSGVSSDDLGALIETANSVIDEESIKDLLSEMFDIIGDHFESDHWRIGERQAGMLGRPLTEMLRYAWAKLTQYIPDILAKWCEETPGATMFVVALGLVVVPRVTKQAQLNKKRGRAMWSIARYRKQPDKDVKGEKQGKESNPEHNSGLDPFANMAVHSAEKVA